MKQTVPESTNVPKQTAVISSRTVLYSVNAITLFPTASLVSRICSPESQSSVWITMQLYIKYANTITYLSRLNTVTYSFDPGACTFDSAEARNFYRTWPRLTQLTELFAVVWYMRASCRTSHFTLRSFSDSAWLYSEFTFYVLFSWTVLPSIISKKCSSSSTARSSAQSHKSGSIQDADSLFR